MLVLALDTATAATTVAVVRLPAEGEVAPLSHCGHLDPRAHGERLVPQIDAALAAASVGLTELAAIVAGTGPGPFTGLRVGLATAAAMGQALGIPTYGVCSLDGIGIAADQSPALVATDARRQEIYWAVYAGGDRLTDPAVNRPEDLLPTLATQGVRQAYGDGARRYREVLTLPVGEHPSHPDPAGLVMVARDRVRSRAPGESLVPRYLRRPHAAEPRPAKPVTGR